MLTHEVLADGAVDGSPVVVLLHGRGADRHDLLGLRPHLPRDWVLVAPDAPFAAAPWGYGPGRAWYRFLGGARPDPESFAAAQRELDAFLDGLPAALPIEPGPIVLGGFSQGGTMSIASALRRPGRVPMVVNFSGFLAEHPEVRASPETVQGARFFWGHGEHDPAIPFGLALEGWAALEDAGADLERRAYPIGHGIAPDELRDAVEWIRTGL